MNLKTVSLVAALLAATTAFAQPAKSNGRVEVNFQQPEKFTDVRESFHGTDRGRDGYLGVIREHLQKRAERYLTDGQTLSVTFTDIDMAGDFEPGRSVQSQDVRIIKDIYPPRMNFSYKVTDASGAVIKQGEEKLVELGFQMNASAAPQNEALRYEKLMLDNWLRDQFGKQKKSGTS